MGIVRGGGLAVNHELLIDPLAHFRQNAPMDNPFRLFAASVLAVGLSASAADRPNILFIYTDDHSHR
ncbi:MAG: hypothetical protein GY953_23680, partial [bacterium]|nr:hypothetical protein [bacterium]